MKKICLIMLCTVSFLTACDPSEYLDAFLDIASGTVAEIKAEGGEIAVNIISSGDYSAWIDNTAVDWISVNGSQVNATRFSVHENTESVPRSGRIFFTLPGAVTRILTVIQDSCEIKTEPEPPAIHADTIVRKSLVFKYTGDWCGYCPFMSFAIRNALKLHPDGIETITIYNNSAQSLSSEHANQLIEANNIKSFPTGVMDFRAIVGNTQEFGSPGLFPLVYEESVEYYPASVGFNLAARKNGTMADLDVEIISNNNASDVLLCVYVVENGIIAYQSFYGNPAQYPEIDFNKYVHDDVLKFCLTSPTGDRKQLTEGSLKLNYSFDCHNIMNIDNTGFVVFALKEMPENRIEKVAGVKYTGSRFYVDNVERVNIGETKTIKYKR